MNCRVSQHPPKNVSLWEPFCIVLLDPTLVGKTFGKICSLWKTVDWLTSEFWWIFFLGLRSGALIKLLILEVEDIESHGVTVCFSRSVNVHLPASVARNRPSCNFEHITCSMFKQWKTKKRNMNLWNWLPDRLKCFLNQHLWSES